jgi:hypothetical protein
MPSDRLTGFSSAFDELLERSRRELDALSGVGSGSPALSPTPRTTSRPRADTPSAARGASIRTSTPASPESRSPAERALDGKLGADWRYEVLDRTREGGEFVVRCRVTAPGRGISRTWIGTAPLSGAGGGGTSGTKGTAGNVSFTLGGGASSGAGTTDALRAKREAERKAVESALAACARLL